MIVLYRQDINGWFRLMYLIGNGYLVIGYMDRSSYMCDESLYDPSTDIEL